MRILLVSNSYPPHVSPRAIRWSAIAEHWASRGDEVHVVAGWNPGAPRQEILSGVHVHRVGGGFSERLRGKLGREKQPASNSSESGKRFSPVGMMKSFLKRSLRFVHDTIWKSLYWPDYACLWSFAATRECRRLLVEQEFDVLVTSSLPFTDHFVGLKVVRHHPDLPWLVDVGDPFSFLKDTPTNNHRLYRGLNRRTERKVFLRGDSISVTNENTKKIYAELFPGSKEKIEVIPPLLREGVIGDSAEAVFATSDRIRIAFIGTLHPTVRTPEHVLSMFRELLNSEIGEKLELHFFGPANHCEPFFEPFGELIGDRLHLHGPVPHAIARNVMSECDVLLNIGNTTTYQLPSKIVEYSSTGNPILNVTTVEGDSSEEVLQTYSQAHSLKLAGPDDVNAQSVAEVVEFLQSAKKIDHEAVDAWCEPFRINAIIEQYDKLLEAAQRKQGALVKTSLPTTHLTESLREETQSGNPMEIAITGASGFIGQKLTVSFLEQDNVTLRLLSRNGEIATLSGEPAEKSVEVVTGDLSKAETLTDLPSANGTVINLVYLAGHSREENIQAAVNLGEAAAKVGIKRLVHCSTAVVAGRSADSTVNEKTDCKPLNDYEETKLAVEQELIHRSEGRFELAILRPTAVFGPRGKNLIKLADDLKHGSRIVNYVKSCLYNKRRMNAVCVANVVSSLIFLAKTERPMHGEVFLISDDEQPGNTYRDIEKRLIKEFGGRDYRFPRIPIPGAALSLCLRLTGRSTVDPHCQYDSRKIVQAGLEKPMSLDEGIHEFADWYKAA